MALVHTNLITLHADKEISSHAYCSAVKNLLSAVVSGARTLSANVFARQYKNKIEQSTETCPYAKQAIDNLEGLLRPEQ